MAIAYILYIQRFLAQALSVGCKHVHGQLEKKNHKMYFKSKGKKQIHKHFIKCKYI